MIIIAWAELVATRPRRSNGTVHCFFLQKLLHYMFVTMWFRADSFAPIDAPELLLFLVYLHSYDDKSSTLRVKVKLYIVHFHYVCDYGDGNLLKLWSISLVGL